MSLNGKIALVTGASRGIGRSIAIELGKKQATIYVTGRSLDALKELADQLAKFGGKCISVQCDHSKPDETRALFEQIGNEQGKLDILINNAFNGVLYMGENAGKKFYECSKTPEYAWDIINDVGLRNNYICCVHAAKLMVPKKTGIIVNISSAGALTRVFNVAYGVGKAAVDKLSSDVASDLKESGITSVSIWPGAVKTEMMLETEAGKQFAESSPHAFANAESTQFVGQTVAHFVADPKAFEDTGKVLLTAQLAERYNIVDEDGTVPKNPYYEIFVQYVSVLNKFRTHTP